MEISKRLDQIDPRFIPLVETLFARQIETPSSAEIVLRVEPPAPQAAPGELPSYFNVLEGLTDQEIAEFEDDLRNNPVRIGGTDRFSLGR